MPMPSPDNLLLQDVEYAVTETNLGRWRRYVYPSGALFEEFVAHDRLFGLPTLHYTRGKCPETGKRIVAKGIIAIGRLAVGGIAIGHASVGVIAIGQLGLGLLFGLGQLTSGFACLGQVAFGFGIGIGQLATGYMAIGQVAVGHYVLAQFGIGTHVWDTRGVSQVAEDFFRLSK